MFTSCVPALLFVWALPHLIPVSALGSSPLEGFIPPADPEDLCRFRLSVGPSPQPCCGSLTQRGMCYSSHVVMSCQKQPWQMLLFCLWNDHVGLTLQTAIIIHSCCSALAKSVLWACSAIIQRQEDVSFAESMKCNILHGVPVLWKKSWENNRKDTSIINGHTCGFITEQHTKWPHWTYSMKQLLYIRLLCLFNSIF